MKILWVLDCCSDKRSNLPTSLRALGICDDYFMTNLENNEQIKNENVD